MKQRRLAVILGAALLAAALIGGAVAALASDSSTAVVPAVAPQPAIAEAVFNQTQAETASDQGEDESYDAPAEDAAEGQDQPITGTALEQASAKALEYLGEGRVTETEIEDEESYYEVEVTLNDGRQIDVQLDEAFNVVGTD